MEQQKLHNLIERMLQHVCVVNNTPTQYYLIIHYVSYNPSIFKQVGGFIFNQ